MYNYVTCVYTSHSILIGSWWLYEYNYIQYTAGPYMYMYIQYTYMYIQNWTGAYYGRKLTQSAGRPLC